MDFKDEGDEIVVIGETGPELGASEYLRTVHGIVDGKPPATDLKAEFEAARAVKKIIHEHGDKVTAVHDCSAGGIGVALAEMAIKCGIGARIDPMKIPGSFRNVHEALFSESNGRYILTLRGSAGDVLADLDVPWAVIGTTGGSTLEFGDVAWTSPNLMMPTMA